ncbi:MAG: hydroxyphenylacetyl-CoA thioesterase PaaI [Betaproteobacteria bacterium]|nr:MAG: hydroxyphenylacetyl-CoA thioesterase PaaI [Betaproteobacteria bacterium]
MTDVRKIADLMLRGDAATRALGMKLEEIRLGFARASMRVTKNMVNGQNVCHGGLIFTLADSTFGVASNTHNQHSLAASCSIDFLAPAHLDDELTAVATEVERKGRHGIYDVRVVNQNGDTVALFRGKSATVKGTWL